MDGLDLNLVLKEAIHATPVWAILIGIAQYFMRKHQKSMENIQESVRLMQMSLATANLPRIQKDLEDLKSDFKTHEQEDADNHTKVLMMLRRINT